MFKFLFILGLLALLVFFIVRRLGLLQMGTKTRDYLPQSDWVALSLDHRSMKRVVKQVMVSVGTGFLLLILILVITAKFRIALIMLPISLYLIGQYFVLINQIKTARRQQILFHPDTQEVKVRSARDEEYTIRLQDDQIHVNEVRAVQKNNGILFGYYTLYSADKELVVPFLLAQNGNSAALFEKLDAMTKKERQSCFRLFDILIP